jgi:uncharacterized protein (TIGR00730 family)
MNSVCVFCGSSDTVHSSYLTAARHTGETLAQRGLTLIYGGGCTGLMGALADSALAAGGQVIGVIIPSMNTDALAHPKLTRMDVTPSMHARKARMHELAEGYLALPGGFGTLDELFETLTWGQVGAHRKPVGLLNVGGYFDELLAMLDHAATEGFIFPEHRQSLLCDSDLAALLKAMENHTPPDEAIKRWMRQT